MTSLQVRSVFAGGRPLVMLIKAASFLFLVAVLCFGWLALSFFKNQNENRRALMAPASVSANTTATRPVSNSRVRGAATSETTRSEATSQRWVYSSAADKSYYHDFKHLQANRDRTAMSEAAAAEKGLLPCPRCFSK